VRARAFQAVHPGLALAAKDCGNCGRTALRNFSRLAIAAFIWWMREPGGELRCTENARPAIFENLRLARGCWERIVEALCGKS